MKGWPCEIMGLGPFARPSCLLVDPGDICPPQAPNLCVDFDIIGPKILGSAYDFEIMGRGMSAKSLPPTLSNLVKMIFCHLLLASFHSLLLLIFSNRCSVYALEVDILRSRVKDSPMGVAPEL
jgi:hypothetical protein